jgi:hypothetical protein
MRNGRIDENVREAYKFHLNAWPGFKIRLMVDGDGYEFCRLNGPDDWWPWWPAWNHLLNRYWTHKENI